MLKHCRCRHGAPWVTLTTKPFTTPPSTWVDQASELWGLPLFHRVFSNTCFYLQVLVNTVNNFLQKDKITVWEALPVDNQRRSLTKLLHTAEQATLVMSQGFKKTAQLDANASDIGKIKKINLRYTLDVD